MFPSKSMMEYMTEMNRLFPRNESEVDPLAPFLFNPCQSPFQSTTVNRSSSSTDSTSPDSYPDLSFHSTNNQRFQETPRARAIVGRKILGNTQTGLMSPAEKMEADLNFWQYEEPLSETPPEMTRQRNAVGVHTDSGLYELFPKEHKSFEYKTPIKSESRMYEMSPNFPDRSPLPTNSRINRSLFNPSPMSNQSYRSRTLSNQSIPTSFISPTWSSSSVGSTIPSQRQLAFTSNFSPRYVPKYCVAGSSSDEMPPTKMCTFCRKNGETPVVYMTHCVKEQINNKHVVTCPILRSHVCSTCGATGDNAHTITYCPVLRTSNNGKPLQSTTITLKNTRIKSNGRRRY